jgi:hypothetical protein
MTSPILRRALAAYGWSDGEPLPTSARIETHARLRYAVLRRNGKVLACYRIRHDGKLKRLVRLPDGMT